MSGFAISGTKGNANAACRQVDTLLGNVDKTKALEVLKGIQTELQAHTGTLKILHTSDGKKDLKFKSGMNFMWITRRDSKMALTAQFVKNLAEKACEGLPEERQEAAKGHLEIYLKTNKNRIKSVDELIRLITALPEGQGAREPQFRQQSELPGPNPHAQPQAPEREIPSSNKARSGSLANSQLSEELRPSGVLREPNVDPAQRGARERSSESASLSLEDLKSDSDVNKYGGSHQSIRNGSDGNRLSFKGGSSFDNDFQPLADEEIDFEKEFGLLGRKENHHDDDDDGDENDLRLGGGQGVDAVRIEKIRILENEKINEITSEFDVIKEKSEEINHEFDGIERRINNIIFTQIDLIAAYKNNPNDRNTINVKLNDLHRQLRDLGSSESQDFGYCRADREDLLVLLDGHLAVVQDMQNRPSDLLQAIENLQSKIHTQQATSDTLQSLVLDKIESPDRAKIHHDEISDYINIKNSVLTTMSDVLGLLSKDLTDSLDRQDKTVNIRGDLRSVHQDLMVIKENFKESLVNIKWHAGDINRELSTNESIENANWGQQKESLLALLVNLNSIDLKFDLQLQKLVVKNSKDLLPEVENAELHPAEDSAIDSILNEIKIINSFTAYEDAKLAMSEILSKLDLRKPAPTAELKAAAKTSLEHFRQLTERRLGELNKPDEAIEILKAEHSHMMSAFTQSLKDTNDELQEVEDAQRELNTSFLKGEEEWSTASKTEGDSASILELQERRRQRVSESEDKESKVQELKDMIEQLTGFLNTDRDLSDTEIEQASKINEIKEFSRYTEEIINSIL